MLIEQHKEKIKLDIIRIKHHSIILRIEQLERNNLIIDWKTKKIKQEKKVWRPKLKRKDTTLEQETTLGQEIYQPKVIRNLDIDQMERVTRLDYTNIIVEQYWKHPLNLNSFWTKGCQEA